MNELDKETIALRAAEHELRQLFALRDSSVAELQALVASAPTSELDSAALVSAALAGDSEGAQAAIHTSAADERRSYLRTLIYALGGEIESKGFEIEKLLAAAVVVGVPAAVAERQAVVAERLKAYANFKDAAKLPNLSADFTSRDSHS